MGMARIDWLIVLWLALALWGARRPRPGEEHLPLEHTRCLKGLCAVAVIFHHLAQRTATGVLMHSFCYTGYLATAVFFFFSGYGMMKGWLGKFGYSRTFLKNRMAPLLVPVSIAVLLSVIVRQAVGLPVPGLWERIVNGDTVVANGWYVVVMLVFCPAFALMMRLSGRHHNRVLWMSAAWAMLWCCFCGAMGYGGYWCNTVAVLPFGMLWAAAPEDIWQKLRRKAGPVFAVSAAGFALTFTAYCGYLEVFANGLLPLASGTVSGLLFLTAFLALSTRIRLGNRVLSFLGSISYEMYILHGLFLMAFRSSLIYLADEARFAVAVFAATIIASAVLHSLDSRVVAWIRRPASSRIRTARPVVAIDSEGLLNKAA